MDLQISVFFLFIFFTAGQSLLCYECRTDYCVDEMVICGNTASKCKSSTRVTQFGYFSFKDTVKGCAVDCHSGSLNLGTVKMSSTCCDTYFCNEKDAPDPRTLAPNGKKCYYCDGKGCSNKVSCTGTEDHCLTATEIWTTQPAVAKGCISKSLCNYELNEWDISCCEGDLCNGESSVIQSVTQSVTQSSIKSATQGFIQNVTQSFDYNSPKSEKLSMYNRAKSFSFNNAKSFSFNNAKSQSFKYNDGKNDKESSTYDSAKSDSKSSNYNNAKSQSFTYNGAKNDKESSTYDSAKSDSKSSNYNNVKSQSFKYNSGKSEKQSSTYNGSKSVTQSFLFLCLSLISLILVH